MVDQATGNKRTITTDEVGPYAVPLLPPGVYLVTISARGFARERFATRVVITETTTIDAKLGFSLDTFTVDVGPPLVQADGPQLGRVVDSRMVSELPLSTRNFTQILSLSPGAATYLPDSTAVGRNTQTISLNGARMTQNNVQINGIDANTMGTSNPTTTALRSLKNSFRSFRTRARN